MSEGDSPPPTNVRAVGPIRGGVSVLFVDDEPLVLRSIVRSLSRSGLEVLSAESGAEALAILGARRVDVLVSDIDMPDMTGLELVRLARRAHPSTLRMLLTGHATFERAMTAINEGEVVRLFPKPFDIAAFCATITAMVERVEKLRLDGEEHSRRARRGELERWAEGRFPGVLAFERDAADAVVIDAEELARSLEAAGCFAVARMVEPGSA